MTRRAVVAGLAGVAAWRAAARTKRSTRLPAGVVPDIGCWFWSDREFTGDGWRDHLRQVAEHSPFGLLTTSIRYPEVEVTDPAVRERIAAAATEARRLGLGLVMDLDVRLARRAFQAAHPAEMQGQIRCVEVPLDGTEPVAVRIASQNLGDHYTFRTTPYLALSGRFQRAWRYRRDQAGPIAGTVEPILDEVDQRGAAADAVTVAIAPRAGWQACVAAYFEYLCADVFGEHLDEFQRRILEQYADVPLAGACKDEWGFPPDFGDEPDRADLWASPGYARAYAAAFGGRDLFDDAWLLTHGAVGDERDAAIGAYMDLGRRRNVEHEAAFAADVKRIFGDRAIVATHPTWFPQPGRREAKKNGLDWWQVPRDWAQTDEVTPLGVRTALCKPRRDGVWINMFYDAAPPAYHREIWSAAAAGGRVNIHPLWPVEDLVVGREALLRDEVNRALCRVRLLNLITRAPLDCPVAVVFGHERVLNWSRPGFGDSGAELVAALWQRGWPTDQIPSTETDRLRLVDGRLTYGAQPYDDVIVYQPDEAGAELARLIAQTAAAGRTRLWRFGPWTRGRGGRPRVSAGYDRLPTAETIAALAEAVTAGRPAPMTPATVTAGWGGVGHTAPPLRCRSRLLDGTHIVIRAEAQPAGDPFDEELIIDGHRLQVRASGLLAVRLDAGRVVTLAAGGLRRFRGAGLDLTADGRLDIALWHDAAGWHGAIQGEADAAPATLARLTDDWLWLEVPTGLAG